MRSEAIGKAVEQAKKASPGKEPFDIHRFRRLYDVTLDIGSMPLTLDRADQYEEQYYLVAKDVRTLQEFAEYRRRLNLHEAN